MNGKKFLMVLFKREIPSAGQLFVGLGEMNTLEVFGSVRTLKRYILA
jgi:hypothetical protein